MSIKNGVVSQAGFSLLEVLIAMLILAFGALGLAGLQMKTLQSSHSAYQRGLANIIAADTVERLWANAAAAAPLTVPQIQAQVQQRWSLTNDNNVTLPGLVATIVEPAAGDTLYTVQITWDETRFDDDNTSFSYSFRLYP
ncbi:type IV pilus modification protein PilV [Rheinheimera sp.]|uniref:type IV pilus modification protein PilV n=1 Tax=Rheinheimera sp. TaxID=1869214 RepID=UPI0027BAA895|nr:type IV pilus modification protein PilV [Rheinheimera sp.]